MTIKPLYPTIEPTLELDFANTKALDPRISFTRASTGTYMGADGLIKTAGNGVARFDHSATGGSLGLLVEEARTNLRTASVDFSTGWAYNNAVTVASGQTSPTGDSSASLITLNAGTNQAKLGERLFPNSTIYARSWFVKKTNQRYIWCGDQNNGSYAPNYRFDLDLGTGTLVSGSGLNVGFSITAHANGYYRISTVCVSQDIFFISANNTTSVNPLYQSSVHDGTETFTIWGYQIEQASFSTSYIPTAGSTVTRAADVASMTGTNFSSWYRQDEGTVFLRAMTPNKSTHNFLNILNSASPTSNRIIISALNTYTYAIQQGGTFGAQYDDSSFVNNVTALSAYAIKANNVNWSLNGAIKTLDTSVTIPTVDRLYFASDVFGANNNTGWYSRLAYYPVRLPDAQLQALTAT
jgi:hypothetical protein